MARMAQEFLAEIDELDLLLDAKELDVLDMLAGVSWWMMEFIGKYMKISCFYSILIILIILLDIFGHQESSNFDIQALHRFGLVQLVINRRCSDAGP